MLRRPVLAALSGLALVLVGGGRSLQAQDGGGGIRYVVAPEGNEVRYRVRERLARLEFPNDAVGKTAKVTGGVTFTESWQIAPGSKFVIELGSLTSDEERRDRYVRMRTLETETHPTAELVPTAVHGLPNPLPPSGEFSFTMEGTFTVKGVTRSLTWEVKARNDNGVITGSATTTTTFADLQLTKPSLAFLLDVSDTIGLEYDFRLIPAP